MTKKTKKVTIIAMLCAIAYVVMVFGRILIVLFLKYDPKDVIVSDTGIIGCIMNIISTYGFACTAAFIYKKMHNVKGAIIGLLSGCLLMVTVMLLWNYYITPFYMGYGFGLLTEALVRVKTTNDFYRNLVTEFGAQPAFRMRSVIMLDSAVVIQVYENLLSNAIPVKGLIMSAPRAKPLHIWASK